MRLMELCRHIRALRSSLVIIIILIIIISIIIRILTAVPASSLAPSLRALLHFFPWSYFRSATALTHTHDETE